MRATFKQSEIKGLISIGLFRLSKLKNLKEIALMKEEHDRQYRINEYEKLGFFSKILADDPRKPTISSWRYLQIHSESIRYGTMITELEVLITSLQKAHELVSHEVTLSDKELLMLELEK